MRENELFESHLQRTVPSFAPEEDEALGGSRGSRKKSLTVKKTQHLLLTTEQKYDIATQEMEEVRDEIERMKANSEKLLDSLRAQMEECDVRIAEIKKDAYEFKRDIVTGAENFRTGKTIAEKAVRYMEEKLRAKGSMAEKLRLKNMTLKTQIQKMEGQLQQKEDMGEVPLLLLSPWAKGRQGEGKREATLHHHTASPHIPTAAFLSARCCTSSILTSSRLRTSST